MRDLTEVFDPSLRLPIRGKEYVIPAPDAATGLRLTALYALTFQATALATSIGDTDNAQEAREQLAATLALTDVEEQSWMVMVLTQAVIDEMTTDGLPQTYIEHAAETAWITWSAGADAGEAYWESGGKAVPARSRMNGWTSTSTGEASSTKTSESGSGTTSRPKSQRSSAAKPRKKKASNGPSSS